MQRFSVIVLAAGGSSRLGQPKQLVTFKGKTLIQNAVDIAQEAGADQVLVVVGAEAESVRTELGRAQIIENTRWREGLSTSIQSGVIELERDCEVVVITLCDQPLITAEHIKALVMELEKSSVAATAYDGTIGVPAAFTREVFSQLLALNGDKGAKSLLLTHPNPALVPLPQAAVDVDTPTDLIDLA
jgi:molybdenum cofactor cytidylyltransferase